MTEQPLEPVTRKLINSAARSILIVEDEAIVAADLKNSLQQLGYRVCGIYARGEEAFDSLQSEMPDLVLMDIHLAGKEDGITTAEKINEHFDLPVVYLTALSDERNLQRAKITMPFGYILKPFEIDSLHSTIEMALYQHRLDQQLRQSEERYRSLFEYSPVPMVELDLSPVKRCLADISSRKDFSGDLKQYWQEITTSAEQIIVSHSNQAMTKLSHVSDVDIYKELILQNIMETNLKEYENVLDTYLEQSEESAVEICHTRPDGSQFTAIMKTSILPGSEETWDRIIYSLYDISDRANTESALKHRLIVEELVSNISARFVNVSPEALETEIYQALKVLGEFSDVDTCYIRLFESDGFTLGTCYEWAAKQRVSLKNKLTGMSHKPYEWLNQHLARGETIYIPDTGNAPAEAHAEKQIWKKFNIHSILQLPLIMNGKLAGFMGFNCSETGETLDQYDIQLYRMVADIISSSLERKQTEEIYHILVDHSSIELYILQNEQVVFANPSACHEYHITLEEIKTRSLKDLMKYIHPDDLPLCKEIFKRVVSGEKNIPMFEIRILRPDGSLRWLDTSIKPIEYLGNAAQQITHIDITQSKITQQELQQSDARLQALFERAGIGITICGPTGSILMANPQFEKMVGFSQDELLKLNCSDITHPDDVADENRIIAALHSGEIKRSQIEKRYVCKNGRTIWGRVTLTLIHYPGEHEHLLVKMIEDISEHRAAEEALLASEERLRLVLEGSRDGFWDWDILNGNVIYSPRWAEMRGFKLEEIDPTMYSWETTIHPNDLPTVRHVLQEHLEQRKEQFECEYRIMTKFGEWKWILDRGVALFNSEGVPVRMTGTQTDITERKLMDVALRESEARFRAIYDNSGVGIALTDQHGDILLSNLAFQKMLGYSPAVLQNMTFYDLTHPEDVRPNQELTWALHARKIEGFQLTKRYLRSNGEIMWGHLTVTPVKDENQNILFVIGMIEDITEQKDAELALKESEQKLRGLIAESRDGIMITDELGLITEWNRALEEICNLPAHDVLGHPLWEIRQHLQAHTIYPEMSNELVIKKIHSALVNGEGDWMNRFLDVTIQTGQNQDKCIQIVIFPVKSAHGHILCAISRDVTADRILKQQLRQGKEEWEATVDALSEMILLTDESGNILRTNRSTQTLFSTQNIEFSGQTIDALFEQLTGLKRFSELQNEVYIDQLKVWWKITSYGLRMDEQPSGKVYVVKDITQNKEMQAALTASQKLSSLGTMVAGLAHEMNSPLQVIISTSESLLKQVQADEIPAKDHLQNYLEMIQRNAWRNAEIVRSLRLYAASPADHIEELDINALVNDVLLLLNNRLEGKENIQVKTDLDASLPPLSFNRNKFSQVMFNLLSNAIDAIPDEGSIQISTRYQSQDEKIIVQVQDSGEGIPQEIQTKIFDPFFTTKPIGAGLGLGLSTVLGIIKSSGGKIGLESSPRQGATFTLYLPLHPLQPDDMQPVNGRYDDSELLHKQ